MEAVNVEVEAAIKEMEAINERFGLCKNEEVELVNEGVGSCKCEGESCK